MPFEVKKMVICASRGYQKQTFIIFSSFPNFWVFDLFEVGFLLPVGATARNEFIFGLKLIRPSKLILLLVPATLKKRMKKKTEMWGVEMGHFDQKVTPKMTRNLSLFFVVRGVVRVVVRVVVGLVVHVVVGVVVVRVVVVRTNASVPEV